MYYSSTEFFIFFYFLFAKSTIITFFLMHDKKGLEQEISKRKSG